MKTISSLQHPLVKRLTRLRKERKAREETGRAVIEGRKLVSECAGMVKTVFYADTPLQAELFPDAEQYLVTPEIIAKISGVKSPEGVLAEIQLPEPSFPSTIRRLLVLEGINDPGNLGTLIRTALALGWEGVFLLGDCCDPYNDKAIRASKGAIFRLPVVQGQMKDFEDLIKHKRLALWVADLEGESVSSVKAGESAALLLGSEAHGPSDAVCRLGKKITIPISDKMESLNVACAGSILMFAM
jgi:RNA methyltransferase, TrmH family